MYHNLFVGISGIWGVIAVGIFAEDPVPLMTTSGRCGILKGTCSLSNLLLSQKKTCSFLLYLTVYCFILGCGAYLLGVQALSAICLGVYSFTTSYIILWVGNHKIVPPKIIVFMNNLVGMYKLKRRVLTKDCLC